MQVRKKPVVVEAITFDELVAHGKANGGNIVGGMPWSFEYKGHKITHENDECYLIPTPEGTHHMTPADMLITGVKGEIYPCKIDIFAATYEPADRLHESSQDDAIRVQMFTQITEGQKVALCVPHAPVINIHSTVFKIQRIRPNGTVVLKAMKVTG